ncbi:type IV pilin-like G/H family protein [Trichocoleus desertorum]|uniref:type IV pilin-like G/H family protein n=1 Tax=Trichocoleus desertorum TaxID=1481672 RepID=UPI003D653702
MRSQQYEYSVYATPTSAFSYGVTIGNDALARPSYVGGVFLGKTQQGEDTTLAILCEAKGPEATLAIKPAFQNGSPVCPNGSIQID